MDLTANPSVVKILAFALFSLPIVVTTSRDGIIPNRFVLTFACAGLAIYAYEHRADFTFTHVMSVVNTTTVVMVVALGLFAIGSLGAGMGKFYVATVPWFSTWDLVAVVAVAGILTVPQIIVHGLIGRRTSIQSAPYLVAVGCLVIGTALR